MWAVDVGSDRRPTFFLYRRLRTIFRFMPVDMMVGGK